jgi:hypothetical protein
MSSSMPTDSSSSSEQLASEEFANRPNAKYQGQNYMLNTLAQGSDEPQRMHKHSYRSGDNPMAMKEGLVGELANLYQEVKLRESKQLSEWGVNLTQPQSDLFGTNGPKDYNDKANTRAMMAKYSEMIKDTEQEIARLKADPSYGGATHDRLLKYAQDQLDGLNREQMHNLTGTGVDDASNALRKQAIANNELTPGQWLQKATQYFKGKMTGEPQPGVSYDRYDTSKQAGNGWTTPTPYKPESINESADILKLAKMLRG